jgi:hypothetical protein
MIGMRYASVATSEADFDRILAEQQELQGAHRVNYGTNALHARLILRQERHT